MSDRKTREPQYQDCLDVRDAVGTARLGVMTNQYWHDDPRRLVFVLARYKFVAKMLSGREKVAELGCGDAFASRVVRQEVGRLDAYDFDPVFIDDARDRQDPRWKWPLDLRVHHILEGPLPERYDGLYSLDVLEHVDPAREQTYLRHVCASLAPHAACLIGMPSLESQRHASPQSRAGHVNCKTGEDFKALLQGHFHSVFLFSMNDEVVHTGFAPMAHYLLALCCEPIDPA